MPNNTPSLFDLSSDGPATRALRDAPAVSDSVLLRDVADAATFLTLGGDAGIADHTVARLRGQILAAVRVLAERWGTDLDASDDSRRST